MLKKLLATTAVLAFVAAASATVTFSWAYVDNDVTGITDFVVAPADFETAGYVTVDLIGTFDGEYWSTAYSLATANGFFNHPNGNGGEMAPDTNNFSFVGLTRFDSFYTGMNDYPNAEPGAGDATAAPGSPLQNTATVREMEWFDYPELDNTGTFTMARFTCMPEGTLELSGYATTVESGTEQFPFAFSIPVPEPASLALLGLGALALIRRR